MSEQSILQSVKHKLGGIVEEETYFDPDLIDYINSAFFKLWQLGVGPSDPIKIEDESAMWDEYDFDDIETVKEWVYLDVKKIFDPPANGSVMQAMNDRAAEDEFRMMIGAEEMRDGKYSSE